MEAIDLETELKNPTIETKSSSKPTGSRDEDKSGPFAGSDVLVPSTFNAK